MLYGLEIKPELPPGSAVNTMRNFACLFASAAQKLTVPPSVCAQAVNVINLLACQNPPAIRRYSLLDWCGDVCHATNFCSWGV